MLVYGMEIPNGQASGEGGLPHQTEGAVMQAYDALGSGAGMPRLARWLGRLIHGDVRFVERGVVAIEEPDVEVPGDDEPWIDVPEGPPTLAIGELDSPLRWLPSAVDPPDRDALASPVYARLTFSFAGSR